MSRRRPKASKYKYDAGDDPVTSCSGYEEASEVIRGFRFHAKPWNAPKKAGRKGQQLCQQVRDALHNAFAACGDPAVQAASVLAVEPAPHSGRLLVLVGAPADVGREEVAEALARAAGHLRSEVALAISRRYAPELTFEVVEAA